ncbi:hypothetical protein CERZMDRAFT_90920 [Cercospora zeae-maydis SCOH1-5]|uniref:Uncharacterized protein n=1 Tax=Cercospora zeae-maydis SCOH1-5 TaxID=717836 RepID=A0A6A6FDG1_9PEZI|nr:hypothetical protein CERZMDRAFT_90920 [Cercospora zeae-maydis SCOH1-5]
MRFLDLSTSAIAAAALLQGVVAADQPQGYGVDAGAGAATTSAVTTYYTTLTVYRVATTVTATRNSSMTVHLTSSAPTTLASATIPSYGNGTTVHPGAHPSTTGIEASPGAASGIQVCSMAVALAAGVVGLLLV